MATRKAPKKAADLTHEVIGEPGIFEQFSRMSGNLTPQLVSSILQMANSGRPAQLVDLMHEIRQKDAGIHGLLQARELTVQGLDWDIVAPEGASSRCKKAAAECKEALLESQNFPELIAHQNGEGNLFGYAYSEIVWKRTASSRLWPDRFVNIHCGRFGFRAVDSKLVFTDTQSGSTDDGIDLDEAYGPGKFISVAPRINGDSQIKEGLARLLVWYGLARNWSLKDMLQLAELCYKPHRLGTYKKTADPKDVAILKNVLQQIGTSGWGVKPDTTEIELLASSISSSGKPVHIEMMEFLGREAGKATLGTADIVEPGANGSRAATETRNELRTDIRESDALTLSRNIRRKLVRPFVTFNYGESVETPEFVLLTEDRQNIKEFSESMVNLRKAGMQIPASYVRDQTGIPEPKPDEELLKGTDTITTGSGSAPTGQGPTTSAQATQGQAQ